MSGAVLLGVDGGGSSTVAWAADGGGNVLARVETGPSNVKAVGESAALAALDSAIREALRDSSPAEVACLGLAGFDRPEDRALVDRWNASRGWARRMVLVNDGELVLAAGTPQGWGVGVIAGTGSIAVGRSADGRSARAGGWGHVFGDEGSGYGTAVAALRYVARLYDGRADGDWRDDALTATVCEAIGVADPSGLVSAVYAPGFDRARLASVAASIVRAADREPTIVRDLLLPAGEALAEIALAVARRLELPKEGLPVALAGGFVLSAEAVAREIDVRLAGAGYKATTCRVDDPVRGALVLARRALEEARMGGTLMEKASTLAIDGEVDRPGPWTAERLAGLSPADQVPESARPGSKRRGDGVALSALLREVGVRPGATYITFHAGRDDFSVSVPLEAVRSEGVVVYRLDGGPLRPESGGPFRFLIPDPAACHTAELDECANVKFLDRIELSVGKGRDTRPSDESEHAALHEKEAGTTR